MIDYRDLWQGMRGTLQDARVVIREGRHLARVVDQRVTGKDHPTRREIRCALRTVEDGDLEIPSVAGDAELQEIAQRIISAHCRGGGA